jgi:hypothetical protein
MTSTLSRPAPLVPTFYALPLAESLDFHLASEMKAGLQAW